MQNKIKGILGLSRKAGKLIIGASLVSEAITRKRVFLVIMAKDTAENTKAKLLRLLNESETPFVTIDFTKYEIGSWLGFSDIAVVGISDRGFAKALQNKN